MYGKGIKRIFACAAVLALLLSCLPLPAMASGIGSGVDYDSAHDQNKPAESSGPQTETTSSPAGKHTVTVEYQYKGETMGSHVQEVTEISDPVVFAMEAAAGIDTSKYIVKGDSMKKVMIKEDGTVVPDPVVFELEESTLKPGASSSAGPSDKPTDNPSDKPTDNPTEKPSQATSKTMWVQTGNDGGLHLRVSPSTKASKIKTYPNGTQVTVYASISGWAYVSVGGQTGYMMLKFLTDKAPAATTPPAGNTPPAATESTTMWIQTGNDGRLHLRSQPTASAKSLGLFPNGTQLTVTARSGSWAYVTFDGKVGWMMLKFLTDKKPGAAAPEAQPPAVTENTLMWIATGNTGRLNLRAKADQNSTSLGKYYNGTEVVVHSRSGAWAYVTVSGKTGYMMLKFLTDKQPAAQNPPETLTPPSAGAYSMWIKTGNPQRLHLREKPSTDAKSLGLYENGVEVTVTATTGAWAYVTVKGKTGYMMMKFLTAQKPGDAPTAEPKPETTNPPANPGPNQATVTQKNGSYVNLRSSKMDTNDSNVIAQVPSGTVVTVLEWGKPFSKIEYNGKQGYMNSNYLVK